MKKTETSRPPMLRLIPSVLLSIICTLGTSLPSYADNTPNIISTSAASTASTANTSSSAEILKGENLYNQNCVFCHQADAIGKTGFAPSLTNPQLLSISTDKFLMSTIRDGRPGTAMPPYGHLGRQDIAAIVSFLRSHETLPNTSAAVEAQRNAQGDPRKGELWFKDICATCHGVKGDGYLAGGSGTAIGKAGFLSKASDGFIRETIKHGRDNTRMLPFTGPKGLANLDEQEIEDIIAYMRTLTPTP